MTDPSREAFEKWADEVFYDDACAIADDWSIERNLYKTASHHMAWHAWQAAMAHKEADAWQPINTAPRDGTTLLLRSAKGRIASGDFGQPIGWANPKCWIWPYLNQEPTHWQPLPAAPLPQGE